MDTATHAIPTYGPSLTPLEAIHTEIEFIKQLLISLHSNILNISQTLSNLEPNQTETTELTQPIEPTTIPTTLLWTHVEHSNIEHTPETPLFPGWERRKRKRGEEVDGRWGSFGEFMRDGAGVGIHAEVPEEETENVEGLIGGTDSNEDLERDIEIELNRTLALFGDDVVVEEEMGEEDGDGDWDGETEMELGVGKKVCTDGSIRGQYEECP